MLRTSLYEPTLIQRKPVAQSVCIDIDVEMQQELLPVVDKRRSASRKTDPKAVRV